MKHLILPLFLLAGALSVFGGGPCIEWLTTVHDFGAFKEEGGNVEAVFAYRNAGDEPLVILGARANCGCTTPRYDAAPLAPGDTALLRVSYDPSGRPGRFTKKVFVDTNTDPRRSTLTLNGVVVGAPSSVAARYPVEVGPLRIAHPAVLLGTIRSGHVKSVFENAYNASTDTLRPVIVDTPEWLEVKTLPEVAAPGEQVSFNFFVRSSRIPDWDIVTDTVTVRPDASSDTFLRVPVVVTVNEDFSNLSDRDRAEAPVVSVAPLRHDPVTIESETVTTTFEIGNSGKKPLRIRRIYTRTPGVIIDYDRNKSIKKGRTAAIRVSASPDILNGRTATTVIFTIITNDPVSPRKTYAIPFARR